MKNKIGFIGAGNMASALILSLCAGAVEPGAIAVFDVDGEKCRSFEQKGLRVEKSAADLTENSEIVFITVKPAHLNEVLDGISDAATAENVFVSVVAGVSTGYIKKRLKNEGLSVVRVMPNTPALLGMGATAVAFDGNISEDKKKAVCDVFNGVGICRIIPEEQMNGVVSVNGSSPAYAYMFINALIKGGVEQGIAPDIAKELALQTLAGSVEMVRRSPLSVEELIRAVCSPKGTTLEAVGVLEERGFEQIIIEAMKACTRRTEELEKEIGEN